MESIRHLTAQRLFCPNLESFQTVRTAQMRMAGFHTYMSESLNAYCVPSRVLSVSHALTHLILTLKLRREASVSLLQPSNLGRLSNLYKVNNG